MNLQKYIESLCEKLRSGEEVKLESLIDMPYRHLIANVLIQHLTGPASVVVEELLQETLRLQGVCESLHNQHLIYKEAHQISIKELEVINAAKPIKPKRAIQSAPKYGNIEQEKLDAAMHGLRKRRAEKKAAQKANKGVKP